MAAAVLSILTYLTLVHGALGPGVGTVEPDPAAPPAATLSFSGTTPIINGSVRHLFASSTFVGPNEAGKEDRLRISVDVMSLTRSFDKERARMAELANTPAAPTSAPPIRLADAVVPASPGARIDIAAADPSAAPESPAASPALDAIDTAAAPTAKVPMPIAEPAKLAYARANEPVTVFNSNQDGTKYSAKELKCLATAVYFEARGEPYRGQVAVAQVVMNRVHYPLYPSSICAVVYQNANMHNACQFSFACDGLPETITDEKSWKRAMEIAKKVSSGALYLPEVANATHYHAAYVYPDWAPRLHRITRIGEHIFYRFKNAPAVG